MGQKAPPATVLYVSPHPGGNPPAVEALQAAGMEVETGATTDEALETVETEDVDCLVSEASLPDTDWPELLDAVRGHGFERPFVLHVEEGSEALARRAIRQGVTDYVAGDGAESHRELVERVIEAVEATAGQGRTASGGRDRRQGQKLIDALSGTFPDSVYVYNERGEYLDVILGRRRDAINTREELLGTTLDDVFDAQTADRLRDTIGRVLETGELELIEYSLDGDDGTRWFEGALAPIADGYRGERAVLLSARDITDRRKRERKLERKNEFLDEFASVVSHDVATPLGVIENKARLVEITGDPSHTSDIYDATERVQTMLDELRELATQGKRVGDTDPVELERVVREAWDGIETGAATLTVESSAAIRADRGRLRQLLENLLGNAVEHGSTSADSQARRDSAEHGDAVTVTVGTLPDGFYVADDGPGIPPSDRDQVFERGYTTATDGTGMGLAIARRIVDGHGWSIGVSDSDPEREAGESADSGTGTGAESDAGHGNGEPRETSGGARFDITAVEFVHQEGEPQHP
jgi:signal transduction histidine kinase